MANSSATVPRPVLPPSHEPTKSGFAADDVPRPLGRYVLLRRIARGGMGEVFLASTTGLEGAERPVVVKIIRREHASDPSYIARFLDEARVQAQLQHSGVAQVIEADVDPATGEPYAVVEHVEGRSLGEVRARAVQLGHRFDWAEAVAIATMIAEALAHVHERKDPSGAALGIVHRDLSPQNVMLGFSGDVKIIDFGTARGQNRRCHTVAGVVFAKPGYVAPEVANGDPGDARVDLYALGIMLWELCAGRRFLQGDAQTHMAAVARNQNDPPPIALSLGAPPTLDAAIARLTAFDREARYPSSRAAARDLAALLGAAAALPGGERGVRARAAHLMQRLFPGEPGRSRGEFAALVAAAKAHRAAAVTPVSPRAEAMASAERGDEGMLPGTRYRLLREIGTGASSTVYEAEHVDLGRRVALKVVSAEHSAADAVASRFRREARVLSRLSHEHLVKVHDFGMAADGRLFCGMDLLEGETLDAVLARGAAIDWRDALAMAVKVLSAIELTHAEGLVHRDIKPENLFLTRPSGAEASPSIAEAGLKLLDFGLAKCLADDRGEGDGVADATGAGEGPARAAVAIVGTPEYMAPEQAASGRIDGRADLYALGCVLYEMLTGRLPFVEPSLVALLDAKIKGSPERLRERAPARQIPPFVDELVMRALARHPSVRFQSAVEMRQAILRALGAPGRARARRRAVGFAAVAAVMALAGAVVVGKGREIAARAPAAAALLDVEGEAAAPPGEAAQAAAPGAEAAAPGAEAADAPSGAAEAPSGAAEAPSTGAAAPPSAAAAQVLAAAATAQAAGAPAVAAAAAGALAPAAAGQGSDAPRALAALPRAGAAAPATAAAPTAQPAVAKADAAKPPARSEAAPRSPAVAARGAASKADKPAARGPAERASREVATRETKARERSSSSSAREPAASTPARGDAGTAEKEGNGHEDHTEAKRRRHKRRSRVAKAE
ncbi:MULTISPECIES: serine/threonine-protein kinase [Sorangium]|uniref:Protein kinase n=1 Tax=Sorangium cellulosum TaxID=56 RepID=A0A4V0NG23_SORCE|nr:MULTISPECIES: serine/threonine-protein kinase [Sorangium]AUX31672.1 protein kinase [Sorangium cellulosum]WCQ91049.1 serine-threonine kinase [Sorangium sp. Soce836]